MEDLWCVLVMWPNCDFVRVCYTNFDEFMIGMYNTKIKLEKRMKQCRSLCGGLCLNYLILNHNDRLDVVSAKDNRASKIHAYARDWVTRGKVSALQSRGVSSASRATHAFRRHSYFSPRLEVTGQLPSWRQSSIICAIRSLGYILFCAFGIRGRFI